MHKCTRTHTHTCTARPCTPACGAQQTPTSWTRFLISRFAACRSSGWLLFRSLVRSCRVTEQVAEPSVSTPEAVSARGANTFQPRHPAEPPQCGGATSVTTTPTDPRSVGTGRAGGLHPSGHLATSETLWLAQLGMLLASSATVETGVLGTRSERTLRPRRRRAKAVPDRGPYDLAGIGDPVPFPPAPRRRPGVQSSSALWDGWGRRAPRSGGSFARDSGLGVPPAPSLLPPAPVTEATAARTQHGPAQRPVGTAQPQTTGPEGGARERRSCKALGTQGHPQPGAFAACTLQTCILPTGAPGRLPTRGSQGPGLCFAPSLTPFPTGV